MASQAVMLFIFCQLAVVTSLTMRGADEPQPSLEPAQWKMRLHEVAERARVDPCNADVVVAAMCRWVGIGSRVNGAVNEIVGAMDANKSVALCSDGIEHNMFYTKMWMPYFQNLANFPVCTDSTGTCGKNPEESEGKGIMAVAHVSRHGADYMIGLKHLVTSQLFTLNKKMRGRVDNLMEKQGIGSGMKFLGVHIRRGDKATTADKFIIPTEKYAQAVKRYSSLLQDQLKLVYLATDDEKVGEELQKLLGGGYRVVQQPPLDDWGAVLDSRDYQSDEAMFRIMADVEILRRSQAFIGTSTSNIGRLVFFLRGKDEPSESMDAGWLEEN